MLVGQPPTVTKLCIRFWRMRALNPVSTKKGTLKTQKGLNVACNSSFFELASGSNSLKRFVLHDHPADSTSPGIGFLGPIGA